MHTKEPYTIFKRPTKNGKNIYYYQFRKEDGTRSSAKSTGCTTLASARIFCNKLYNSGEFKKDSSLKFSVYVKNFFSENSLYYLWKVSNKQHISKETLLAYNKFLRNQLLPYFEDYRITEIKRADVKQWVIWANNKWAPKTVNNAQTVLNIIFKQAIDEDIISVNPCYNISFRDTEKKKRELLTLEEVKAIYNSEKWWYDNKLIFLLDIVTGMRISEVVALKNEFICENYIKVEHSYSRAFGLGETKTYMNRCVPIPEDLAKKLFSEREFLFINHKGKNKGKPLNITTFNDNLRIIYESLGIDKKKRNLNVHTNRNFFISYLESKNVPEPKIRAVVGHKDSSMTGLYTYWKPEMFPEVYKVQLELYNYITRG